MDSGSDIQYADSPQWQICDLSSVHGFRQLITILKKLNITNVNCEKSNLWVCSVLTRLPV